MGGEGFWLRWVNCSQPSCVGGCTPPGSQQRQYAAQCKVGKAGTHDSTEPEDARGDGDRGEAILQRQELGKLDLCSGEDEGSNVGAPSQHSSQC